MERNIVYELNVCEIAEILAKYFGVDIRAITLSAIISVMGYEIEAPIKAEIKI